jgi:hypothetical protein
MQEVYGQLPKLCAGDDVRQKQGSPPGGLLKGTSKNPLRTALRPICFNSARAPGGISPASPTVRPNRPEAT